MYNVLIRNPQQLQSVFNYQSRTQMTFKMRATSSILRSLYLLLILILGGCLAMPSKKDDGAAVADNVLTLVSHFYFHND